MCKYINFPKSNRVGGGLINVRIEDTDMDVKKKTQKFSVFVHERTKKKETK